MQVPVRYFQISLLVITGCSALAAQGSSSPVEKMLSTLSTYDRDGSPTAQRVAFEFPEVLINSYLSVSLSRQPRPGIESATVHFLAGNHLTVEAQVNFSAIEENLSKTTAQALKGIKPVNVQLSFDVRDGKVKLKCDRFVAGEKPLSGAMAQEVLRAIASLQPEKFDTTQPIPLPYGLKRLSTTAGTISADTGR